MCDLFRSAPVAFALSMLACGPGSKTPDHAVTQEVPTTLAELDQRILSDPRNATLYADRARFQEERDSLRSAVNDWKRAVSLDSTAARWRIALADLYYRKVDLPNAEAQLNSAIAIAPDSSDARLKLAEIKLVKQEFAEAMKLVNEALRLDDQNPKAYFLKGWIHAEAGDTALAISSYQTAAERDRDMYQAYIALGLIHAAKSDPLALQYYNSAIELRPQSVEAWYDKGMYAQENGQDSLAMVCYSKIKEIDPKNATAWYNTGYVLLEHLDRPAEARKEFSQAIAVLPTYAQAYYNRGLTFELEGQLDSALLDYRQALVMKPDFDLPAEGLERLQRKGVRVRQAQ